MGKTQNKPKNNTIEAVAKAAGVSTMTVSRVLRDTGKVSEKTRIRVQAAMEKLGYVHNRLASALASSRSMQIAVIVPSVENIVFTEVLAGITAGLENSGYQAVIGISNYDVRREFELVHSMLAWRPAGFVLAHPTHMPDTVKILKASNLPVIELMEVRKHPIDMCIGLKHHAAGRAMAKYMISKGYRKFGYLGSNHQIDTTAAKRYRAFKSYIEKNNAHMVAKLTVDAISGISLGRTHLPELLETSSEFEALYVSNDAVAAGAMMHCLAEGINVPGDLAIGSFSGLEIASAMPIPITTIKSPRYTMGKIGVEQILKRLDGESFEFVVDAGFEVVEGMSS